MPRALALTGDTIARVDAFIESEMRDAGIPGVALAIVALGLIAVPLLWAVGLVLTRRRNKT